MTAVEHHRFSSPLGTVEVAGTDRTVTSVLFTDKPASTGAPASPAIRACVEQLREYFAGRRVGFDLPLQMNGPAFQAGVWKQLLRVPYGKTQTYGAIAKAIRHAKASRAVGTAVGRNPFCIVVPCHRIVNAHLPKGSYGKYSGGVWRKQWLLEHEQKMAKHS